MTPSILNCNFSAAIDTITIGRLDLCPFTTYIVSQKETKIEPVKPPDHVRSLISCMTPLSVRL